MLVNLLRELIEPLMENWLDFHWILLFQGTPRGTMLGNIFVFV